MLGQIISGKLAAAILAGAVATTGAAATSQAPADNGAAHRNTVDQTGHNDTTNETGSGKGQGATISALAKSIPGGPGKGAQIGAAAKGHGQAVSADAKSKAKSGKPATAPGATTKPATPASPKEKPTN